MQDIILLFYSAIMPVFFLLLFLNCYQMREWIVSYKAGCFFKCLLKDSHDVVDPLLVEVDQIYHLACPASPVHYQSNPVKTLKTGFFGTYAALSLQTPIQ